MANRVMLALPSKGAIAEPTLSFLNDCGLKIEKPNPRQYVGLMPALPQVDVLFQRAIDVLYKVSDGTARLGVTGYDIVQEYGQDDVIVIHKDLRYGHCNLVVAVPEAWIDVENMVDLAEIALDLRERKGRQMRVATTYPNSTRRFLHASGIHHFTLVNAEGAIEAAPTIGYADIIVDLVQTGTTLRENHLKPLPDGVIIESQACLIGNKSALLMDEMTLETVRMILEQMDASMNGRGYSQLTVNILGESAEQIGAQLIAEPVTAGLQGPTIAPIYGSKAQADGRKWFTVTLIVPNKAMPQAVEILRRAGGSQITSIPVRYVYLHESPTFAALKAALAL
ncbi:MAG: ATP phosphoribosyltransferase [Pleurocapsa minor GSE-CHR-MK-17-07R]|jgi:ATP phosphoribosyltransferase|nr:ATP phosphoribosyltransferase [Pleurocapsa minor GSE-CHR-MK 17-07R]